ncbi:Ig-like domain-containing protein [Demequina globuliformis]|uniref:Ig-like domain-containing protein n=1 Tax=Demequina globuliformis TaxID=676202 RepID=UPI000780BA5E|nr:Ig-like domain-containing protein [Demequina globuliformis]
MSGVEEGLGRATAARWRNVRRAGVGLLIAAVGVGAFLAPGFDEREITPDSPSVWALQTSAGQRMARINTSVSELDTVKQVASPTDLVQADDTLLVYSNNLGSVTTMNVAQPHDIAAESPESTVGTPLGTDVVHSTGDYVVYLTDTGEVFTGSVSAGTAVTPVQLDPFADVEVAEGEDRPQFVANAVAVSTTGQVAAYSIERRAVLTGTSATELRTSALPEGPDSEDIQLAWVGERWVLLDGDSGLLWIQDVEEPVSTGIGEGAALQKSGEEASTVAVADEYGLVTVTLEEPAGTRVHGSTESLSLGEAARPLQDPASGGIVAAWLPEGTGPGTLWRDGQTPAELSYGGQNLGERVVPTLRTNGSRLILNEGRSGWVWDVRTGRLVPSSQAWDADDDVQVAADDEEVATEVTEPRPPVAEKDSFGVRAGRQIVLPVLLNDHDPNKDVLTIEPGSVTGLSESFGTVAVADDAQAIVVDVLEDVTGTASFTYSITDGTTDDGLMSDPASVSLTVQDSSVNSPPEWCGVDDCQLDWPAPQVSPGGTVTADVLTGWVDPEGDPIYLAGATTTSSVGVVAASPEGQLVFQHTDASSTETGAVPISVTVSDVHGASETKDLAVAVLGEPELLVKDAAVTVSAGVTAAIDVADHVTGARGPLTVTEATLGPDDDAVVTTLQGDVGFSFVAEGPGNYVVDFVVSDGVAEARGAARVTVVAAEDEQLTTVPLTAFVRAKEDVTVDVLAAVTNPRRSVLLLSDLSTAPADGAQLSADIVGHSALRLSGDTSDGQPGALGTVTYTVSDGSGRPEGTVTGEVTVVLLGTDVPSTPLAVDDAITVRANTQADIKVLANDIAPAGNVIALDAASVSLSEGGGLAFPAGSIIRYLAPSEPGTYAIDYGAYVLGYPTQADTAKVVVTVTADETNQPPVPKPISGRVASGQEVRLPFDGTGADPDGDAVTLKGIETQPESGAARVSSDGRSLVYTADSGFAGQVSFTFTVEDARGATAVATASVGVLAAELDPRPVTYTDYVQAQVGDDRRVVINPTANDQDLSGGLLQLLSVTPDANPDSDEYAQLDSHLVKNADGEVALEDGRVTLDVGTEPGTYAYVYTVANDSGSTSIGRIILKAVREPIADVPIIADTILTSENRDTFTGGVDVITGMVSWGAGDVNELALSVWGTQDDLTVSGWQIAGPLPQAPRLIPFQVTGANFAGEDVVSYGFLRIPGEQEIRVSLRENFAAPEVNENESVSFDMRDLIALSADTSFTIPADAVSASGARAQATCALVSGTTLRYDAGEGEPYTDTCQVPILVEGADEPEFLPVPIIVIPEIAQPVLTGAALEISPGDSASFDLGGMVTWPDGADGRPVEIGMTYVGEQFTVSRSGDSLTIVASDTAVPGAVDTVTVTLTSEAEVAPVTLTLEVGPAPSTLPKGGSTSQQCSQSDGNSCTISVIGASGEVNPFTTTPLVLDSVSSDGTCKGVTFSVASDTAVRASWTGDTAGAVCNASFVVVDAQGRKSSGDRLGQVSLDLQGFPGSPSALSQTAYGDGTVTLAVDPGPASASYPGITGFTVTAGGSEVATCTAKGACSQITGLANGEKTQYTVVANNSVGNSKGSASTTAWSYAPPQRPSLVSWKPSKAGDAGLKADLVIRVQDSSTRQLSITSPTGEQRVVTVSGRGNQTVSNYLVGSNAATDITITPVTGHEIPPVGGGSTQGEALSARVNGVGAPQISNPDWTSSQDGRQVTFTVDVASAGAGSTTWLGVSSGGRCEPTVQANGGRGAVPITFSPNEQPRDYTICAQSRYDSTAYGDATTTVTGVFTYVAPGSPPEKRSGYSFFDRCGTNGALSCEAGYNNPHYRSVDRNFTVRYGTNPNDTTENTDVRVGEIPSINAYHCISFGGAPVQCADNGVKVATDSTVKYRAGVQYQRCWADGGGRDTEFRVEGNSSDYTVTEEWFRDQWGTRPAEDGKPWTFNYARIKVAFSGNLQGVREWTSGLRDCDNSATEQVEVPGVMGLSRNDAERAIRNANLTPVVVTRDTKVESEAGTVLSQSPGPGNQVDINSNVTIEIGNYVPDPEPSPDPTAAAAGIAPQPGDPGADLPAHTAYLAAALRTTQTRPSTRPINR